jgi:UDP-N-acetyl-D-mannosaminuronic acid dehydrogenase
MSFNTVSIIGLGYIGLPTAALFASRKIKVIGVDLNQRVVNKINQGEIHIIESGLDIVVRTVVKEGYLKATTIPEPADAFLITVPTPFKKGHKPDLSYIESATKAIAPLLQKGNLIVLESTSPIGTTEKVAQWIQEKRPELNVPEINIAHCPERVLPGHIMRELIENDRVIGGLSSQCAKRAVELYKIFVEGDCITTSAKTAELTKLAENSFRDVNIAFANELSLICDKHNIDVWELIDLANRHPRVNILKPGPGVGGHCIAVDPWFIVDSAPEQAKLISTARIVNDNKPAWVVKKVMEVIRKNNFREPTVVCFGLSYKANSDDTRASPSIDIIKKLIKEDVKKIIVIEPNVTTLPGDLAEYNNIELLKEFNDVIEKADILLVLVNHKEFNSINWATYHKKTILNMVDRYVSQ